MNEEEKRELFTEESFYNDPDQKPTGMILASDFYDGAEAAFAFIEQAL